MCHLGMALPLTIRPGSPCCLGREFHWSRANANMCVCGVEIKAVCRCEAFGSSLSSPTTIIRCPMVATIQSSRVRQMKKKESKVDPCCTEKPKTVRRGHTQGEGERVRGGAFNHRKHPSYPGTRHAERVEDPYPFLAKESTPYPSLAN